MSEDTYATVDKSKKIKYRRNPSYTFSSGPVKDIYAQVDKSKKSFMKLKNTPDQDHYDAIPTGSIYYNTVDVTASKIDVLYDSASSSYSLLSSHQGPQSTTVTGYESQRIDGNKKKAVKPIYFYMCLLSWLLAMIALIFVCAAAIIMAFVFLTVLQSDVNMLTSRSSDRTITAKLEELQMKFQVFTFETKKRVDDLRHTITIKSRNAVNLAIDLKRIHDRLVFVQPDIMNMINDNASNLTNLIDDTFLNMSTQIKLTELNIYIKFNKSRNIHNTIDNSIQYITNIIQENYVFESCISINTFTLPFSSGEYLIQTSDTVSRRNCTIYSCDGQSGGWSRVVYLNVSDSSASSCPGQLETVDSPSYMSCRNSFNRDRGDCASVTYHINNVYKCLFGRVSGYFVGTLDGFQRHGSVRPQTPNVNDNYVDGVILTYGNQMKHIWTYAAVHRNNRGCTSSVIPSFLSGSSQYTCEVRTGCTNGQICGDTLLWTGGQFVGPSVFYRELPQITSDNITMRVCRDEPRSNEDILITLVEIYAKGSG